MAGQLSNNVPPTLHTHTHRHPHTTLQTGSRHSSPKKVCNTVNYESSKWFSWWLYFVTASKHRGRPMNVQQGGIPWMLVTDKGNEITQIQHLSKWARTNLLPTKTADFWYKGCVQLWERESACCPQNSWLALKRQTEVKHFLLKVDDWSSIQSQLGSHPL